MKKTIERLKEYIDYKDFSLNYFDSIIGASNGYIGKQIKNNASVGSDVLEKIFSNFDDLNPIWLITGNGTMINDFGVKKTTPKTTPNATSNYEKEDILATAQRVPLQSKYDIEHSYPLIKETAAFGGFADNAGYSVNLDAIEDRYVIPLFDKKGVDFLIQVRGSSMYPKYSSGDIVACRFVRERLFIQWNKVYVLDTISQGSMIKRLKKASTTDTVICKSDNTDYDDFEVPFSDIQNLALVIGVIRLE